MGPQGLCPGLECGPRGMSFPQHPRAMASPQHRSFTLPSPTTPCTLPSSPHLSLSLALPLSRTHRAQATAARQPGGRHVSRHVARGKFQTFDRPSVEAEPEDSEEGAPEGTEDGGRADDVLPGDLASAIRQAGTAAATFCNAGGTRAIVELLIPDLEVLPEDGAQQRVWDSSRAFLEALKAEVSCENVRAVFPDAGAAAMLRYQWGPLEIPFAISSLNDRNPVAEQDDLVVLVAPDYQLLEKVERIAGGLAAEDGLTRPMILWNPRLSSGDVGIGLNVRRMRDFFLKSFTTTYFLRPLGMGAIFRCYPSPWYLFLDDPDEPGRYVLYRQQGSKPTGDDIEGSKPTGDDIEEMYLAAAGKTEGEDSGPSFLDQLTSTVSSLSRFMRSLGN